MTKLNPAAIDTPSRINSLDNSRSTKASNRLLAFLVAVLILTAGVALGSTWSSSQAPSSIHLPKCSALAPSFHHALCMLPGGNVLAANGDVFTPNGQPVK